MKLKTILWLGSSFFMAGLACAIEPVYDGDNGIREKVFATNCLDCHSSTLTGAQRKGAPDTVNWDTYDAAKSMAPRAIVRAVQNMTMPPASSGLPVLNTEQKAAMLAWQNAGFPKNNAPAAPTATFEFDTKKLTLPVVNVGNAKFQATLKLTSLSDSPTGFGFVLDKADLTTASSETAATFNASSGQVLLPKVNLMNKESIQVQVSAEMALVPGSDPLLFSLVSVK
ncbi:MAG: hypothetical protein ABL903_11795 [Methylococcales bacterium]